MRSKALEQGVLWTKTSCDLTERFPLCLITQWGSHSLPSTDNLFLHTKLHAPNYTHFLHSKLLLNMATPTPASESPSGEGTINVPRSDCSPGIDPKWLDTPLTFFSISFCNIRGLRSNFQSVEHHLSSTKPHLFLSETGVWGN